MLLRANQAVDALTRFCAGAQRVGQRVVALKGTWLHLAGISSPLQRPIADVDVLIGGNQAPWWRAEAAFNDKGHAEVVRLHGQDILIDVHRHLFPYRFRRFCDAGMFDGATEHATGAYLPHPLKGYAHLVGNFVKGRYGGNRPQHLADFGQIAQMTGQTPRALAGELERAGLTRSAYVVFALARARGYAHGSEMLAALSPDRMGRVLGTLAVHVAAEKDWLPAALAYASDETLSDSALSLARRLFRRVR